MNKGFLYVFLCFILSTAADAANRVVTGVVLAGDDNQPLVGVSIQVPSDELKKAGISSNTLGTITDVNGNFSISVPDEVRRLVFTYIGYQEESLLLQDGRNDYRIVLQSGTHMLADVVVTGYQTVERRRLTAAVSKIDVSEAVIGAAKSIDQALAGQIAGVSVTNTTGSPGAPARIRIRGTASLNGTQDPLWVMDGMPLEGTDIPRISSSNDNDIINMGQTAIAGISPNDIESITILKDAAATAIYGARAANGVIVITTKRGRSGKPVINFNTRLTYMPNLNTSRLNLLRSEEKVDLELELMKEPDDEVFFSPVPVYATKGGVAAILTRYNLLEAYRKNGWNGLTPEAQQAINNLKTVHTDWNDILYRDAFTQEYNLSLSGGAEKITYYNSLGYTKENGNVPAVSMDRFNLTSKTDYRLSKVLKLGFSLFVNRRKNNTFVTDTYGFSNPNYYSRIANPYFAPFSADSRYLYDYDIATGNTRDLKQGFNIFEERANSSDEATTTAINSIFDAELRFGDHWKLSSQVGVQWEQYEQQRYVGQETFSMRNARINSHYWDNASKTNKYLLPEGGMHKTTDRTMSQIMWKTLGEYKNTFADSHDVQAMIGSEIRKNRYDNHSVNGYGYNPRTLTTKPLIFRDEAQARAYPLYTKNYQENAFASFFANGSYSLMKRYILGASVRMDGSDLFGVDKKYRYLPIYSVSGLWRLSNEAFLQSYDRIDNLALRLSYGLQGNIDKNTSPFLIGRYENISILPGVTEENITISDAPNSKLRWEKTASYNLGVDFSAIEQRINLSIDYYYRKGTDLIGTRMLPLENGFTSMSINWASMENRGIEVNLQTRNIMTKDFSWYTSFNFAYNRNKVLRQMVPDNQTTPGLEGYPVGAIFALEVKSIDPQTGRIYIANPEGKAVTLEELYGASDPTGTGFYEFKTTPVQERTFYKYIGSSDAPYTGGLMNTFTYHNWELSVNFAYHLGAYVRTSPSYKIVGQDPGHNVNRAILERWSPANPTGTLPALLTRKTFPADYSLIDNRGDIYRNLSIWVKKQNYIRLQNIRLAYRMPAVFLHPLHISGATLALEGRNLLVFGSSYKNYMDPESMGNLYATPIPKSITFNFNLDF